MATVETALGPVATTELGPTLMHEHVVTRSPGVQENWPHLWDRAAILAIAERRWPTCTAAASAAIVDLTTVDLGRDIDLILGVARRSRVHIVVATGVWWMPQRYFSAHGVDAVADLFVRDITQGIGTSGVNAELECQHCRFRQLYCHERRSPGASEGRSLHRVSDRERG